MWTNKARVTHEPSVHVADTAREVFVAFVRHQQIGGAVEVNDVRRVRRLALVESVAAESDLTAVGGDANENIRCLCKV